MPGRPAAETNMSASLTAASKSSTVDFECTTCTDASAFKSISAMGTPTIFERPTTVAFLPSILTPRLFNISITPEGVQGRAGESQAGSQLSV
eukprot:CAMPEP_0179475254 /NCGR_PEP_ID=MMETSP0799-20121207/54500_1 /TAXON_ID=46947 /ORGANISM="Geminigera cryophila, Strain CCMP2564" /LENGTH=91 /DNA_ID=CAMNT_0021284713 /DNA_START=102 /DNA_END=377 /DNA_ORIENTATION=-